MSQTAERSLIKRIQSSEKAVWVFCGDSITDGMQCTAGGKNYVELIAYRVRDELERTLHIFVNSAVMGHTTTEIGPDLEHRVLRFKPDVFSLMIGMNDCTRISAAAFGDNLKQIVQRVRQSCQADVVLQTPNTIHPELHPEREAFGEFMDVIRQVAEESKTVLIDHQRGWEQVRTDHRETFDGWMADRGHPNAAGHWKLAETILHDLSLGAITEFAPPKGAN